MLQVVPEALHLLLSVLMSFSRNAPEELRCVCEELLRVFRSPLKCSKASEFILGGPSFYCIQGKVTIVVCMYL